MSPTPSVQSSDETPKWVFIFLLVTGIILGLTNAFAGNLEVRVRPCLGLPSQCFAVPPFIPPVWALVCANPVLTTLLPFISALETLFLGQPLYPSFA